MLELNNVTAGYGKMIILEDISIRCNDNEIVLVFGRNGAGKTTLMRTIYRFTDIYHGEMRYNGCDLTGYAPHDMLPRGIGYIWQRDGFFPSMTVKENFKMALYSLGERVDSDRVDEVINYFPRLKQKLGQTASTLSGGEKKMLSIACVLAQDPDLLLVDEISEGLHPVIRDEVMETISSLVKKEKKSAIIVEEPVEKVLRLVSRAYCLLDGAIVAEGTAQDFLDKPDLYELYLGEVTEKEGKV